MLLHEAVQTARKDLRLSQKRLAELAGVQRKQLATLEAGGNITLTTLRKVLAQLPNLQTFTIDAVTATVRRDASPPEQKEVVAKAIEVMQTALVGLIGATKAGRMPGEREMMAFERANEVLYSGLGYTADDVRREYSRIGRHHLAPPTAAEGAATDLVTARETAASEVEPGQVATPKANGIEPDAIGDDENGDEAD